MYAKINAFVDSSYKCIANNTPRPCTVRWYVLLTVLHSDHDVLMRSLSEMLLTSIVNCFSISLNRPPTNIWPVHGPVITSRPYRIETALIVSAKCKRGLFSIWRKSKCLILRVVLLSTDVSTTSGTIITLIGLLIGNLEDDVFDYELSRFCCMGITCIT